MMYGFRLASFVVDLGLIVYLQNVSGDSPAPPFPKGGFDFRLRRAMKRAADLLCGNSWSPDMFWLRLCCAVNGGVRLPPLKKGD